MQNLKFKTLFVLLFLQAVYLGSPSTVNAEEMACETHTGVTVDVKPGDAINKVNLSSRGLLPVAVLTTEDFDASLFTAEMAHLSDAGMLMGCGGAEAVRWAHTDVDEDGDIDLVFFFRVQDLNLTLDSTAVMLMAHGAYGSAMIHIMGMDTVLVKPK